jgi:hypothetical protein
LKKNSSKLTNEGLGENTLKITKNDLYNFGDEIHAQRSAILRFMHNDPSTQMHGKNQRKTHPNSWMKNQVKILQKSQKRKMTHTT